MKKFALIIALTFVVFGNEAEAQNCNQGAKLASDTWQAWGPWRPKNPVGFKADVRRIKNGWNAIVSNGNANIGPRFLETDEGNESGTIMGQTQRTFITPPSFTNRMEVVINKHSGRAQTGVSICAVGKDGVMTQLHEYTFPNDNNGAVKKFNLNNVQGKIIIVAMRNQSVGNKFQYHIRADAK